MVLEDLGDAHWPPPWTPEVVEAARRALDELAGVAAPAGLPALADDRTLSDAWDAVAADPEPFLALGLCSRGWLRPQPRDGGGPPPEELVPRGAAPGLVSAITGFVAARAGLPEPPFATSLRALQLGQLRVALPWAARELGLPVPA